MVYKRVYYYNALEINEIQKREDNNKDLPVGAEESFSNSIYISRHIVSYEFYIGTHRKEIIFSMRSYCILSVYYVTGYDK